MTEATSTTIGILSDTHGRLRESALGALRGSGLIIHGGDVGGAGILEPLREIAEVVAVRGNVDSGPEFRDLPIRRQIEVGGVTIHVIHILHDLGFDPAKRGIDVVVFGHSHRPEIRREGDVLYFNPGSAGPRRFDRPISVGRLHLEEGRVRPELVELTPEPER